MTRRQRMLAMLSLTLSLIGCAASTPAPGDRIPDSCFKQPAKAFVHGEATCNPDAADTCAFDAHNEPTPLDGSGNPLAYYCTCGSTGLYTCWRAPWFATPEPV